MAGVAQSLSNRVSWVFLRAALRIALRDVDVRVEGLQHLPAAGPAVIAARHYHHLYDGAALLTLTPRPLRAVVTLDWAGNPAVQWAMRNACRAAGWPVVPRSSHLPVPASRPTLKTATRQSVALLRAGRVLLVFPEGYPTIDPVYTPKTRDDEVLPFQPGFLRFAALAERDGCTRVPIVPVGLEYRQGKRWELTVRFGSPAAVVPDLDMATQADVIAARVRSLSGL